MPTRGGSYRSGRGDKAVSFAKVLDATIALCRVLEIGRDLVDETEREEWILRVLEELAENQTSDVHTPRENHHPNESLKALEFIPPRGGGVRSPGAIAVVQTLTVPGKSRPSLAKAKCAALGAAFRIFGRRML